MQNDQSDSLERDFERFRNYLEHLARSELRRGLYGKVEPEAVVNQALYEAMQQNLNPGSENVLPLLELILKHRLIDEIRKYQGAGRDASLERSIIDGFQQSSACLVNVLAADHTSPSEKASRNELLVRLADALAQLPARQREAVECKHLDGMTLQQTADRLGASKTAVAGLVYRGLCQLRELLDGD